MVLNFLITEKSIVAERSSVPIQISKWLTTSAFSSKILVQKGQGKLGQFKVKSEVYELNSPFSSLRLNWLDQNFVNELNFSTKSMTNLPHLFKELSLILIKEIRHYQQSEKKGIISFLI